MKLTCEQQAARSHDGNLLLTACPGSGKTRTIVAKLIQEVEKARGTPFAVACITYTNAAVHEIDSRVAAHLMPDDELQFVVSTIHSFCLHQVLAPFAYRVPGFNGRMRVLTPDRTEFKEIADFAAGQVGRFDLQFEDYERFGRIGLDTSGNIIGSALEDDMIRIAAPYFLQRARARGFIDFASILYNAFLLLRDDAEVCRSVATKFKFFLVDEFQDTTEIQLEILRHIHAQGRTNFFLVGDPAQSIFGFAGARPELIAPFAEDIGARADLSLSGNFRSSPPIVRHAERLFPRYPPMTSRGTTKDITVEPKYVETGGTLTAVIEEFLPAIDSLKLPIGRSAILAKSWFQLYGLARGLREHGVKIVGPGARPYRRTRTFAILAEQLGGAVIDGYLFNIRLLERAAFNAIQEVSGQTRFDIYGYSGRRTIVGLMRIANQMAETTDGIDWLKAMAEQTAEVFIMDGWLDPEFRAVFLASVDDMVTDMEHNNIDVDNLSIEDLGMFASPDKALRLMTIHESKGREFAAVAIVGMRDGNIPFYRAKIAADIEAEKRQFYVAVTRAEQLLMYVYERDRRNPPSRFLGSSGVGLLT